MSSPAGTLRLDPGWLVAAAPRGIVCARGARELVLELEAPFGELVTLLRALAAGAGEEEVAAAAGVDAGEARRALEALRREEVLGEATGPAPPEEGLPLAEAILRVGRGEAVSLAWTADEALVVPEGTPAEACRRAIRAFVAGLAPDARLEAYCAVATWRRESVMGDVPDAGALARAVARARDDGPDQVHAVRIGGERIWSVAPDDVGVRGMQRPHRLGPLQRLQTLDLGPPLRGLRAHVVAEYAVGNLAQPWPVRFRVGRGTSGEAGRAEVVARAEAAERWAAYDVDPRRLRRAGAGELEGAVPPDRLHRFNVRQYAAHPRFRAYRPGDRPLWIEGFGPRGETRWVPAELVHVGFHDPEHPRHAPTSSSGLAAGADRDDAAERAVRELIERDAFMWTWVQRVSRERIDPGGLPPDALELARAIERMGYEVALVNLTLETKPVVMSVLHGQGRVHVAAACRENPREAAAKALDETALVLALESGQTHAPLRPEDVRAPEDHMWLHLQAEHAHECEFLWAGDETIGLEDIASVAGPAIESVAAIGEPVIVDLSTPRTAPFAVTRALVPGIAPLSVGWDQEALGLERLAEPKRTVDGRRLGETLDLPEAGPIMPHPFP